MQICKRKHYICRDIYFHNYENYVKSHLSRAFIIYFGSAIIACLCVGVFCDYLQESTIIYPSSKHTYPVLLNRSSVVHRTNAHRENTLTITPTGSLTFPVQLEDMPLDLSANNWIS